MGQKSNYPALFVLVAASLAPMRADAQTRGNALANNPQPSACCTASDLLFCRDFQLCHPFPARPATAKRGERLQDRAVLGFGPRLLPAKELVVSSWTPVGGRPLQEARSAEGLRAQAQAIAATRAGYIRDNEAEPEFPIIAHGAAAWTAKPDGPSAQMVQVMIKIEAEALQLELVFRSQRPSGPLTISLLGGPAAQSFTLAEMPRARRAGAIEGEPLLGRIAPGPDGGSRVELSSDPIDVANNKRRLLATPWLDFRLADVSGKTSIVTIEKGRAANEMLAQLLDWSN